MNELFHICRSVANSENAIHRLNKGMANMAKCCRLTNARVTCVAIGMLLITAVVAMQGEEIKALRKQVADLTAKPETTDITEEQTEQEGA